jgi:hypothetical protein
MNDLSCTYAEDDEPEQDGPTLSVELILNLTVDLNGMEAEEGKAILLDNLNYAVDHIGGAGLITSSSPLTVNSSEHAIDIAPSEWIESIDESDIADDIRQRVEDGNLSIDQLISMAARLALQSPQDSSREFYERINNA